MENYNKLVAVVADMQSDAEKTEAGNKAAGQRFRKKLGEVKDLVKILRAKSLAKKSS